MTAFGIAYNIAALFVLVVVPLGMIIAGGPRRSS